MLARRTARRLPDFARACLGITREAVFIQSTPGGDAAVVYWEADDVEAALKGVATSQEPFDQWFRAHISEVHGLDVAEGFPPPEQVMDCRASDR